MKQQNQVRESKQKRLNDIKQGNVRDVDPDMIKWFLNVYLPMPPWEKQVCKKDWDNYFEECAMSNEAMKTYEAREALRKGQIELMREIIKRPIESKPITKPAGYDPEIWENAQWGHDYRVLTHELNGKRSNDVFDSLVGNTY